MRSRSLNRIGLNTVSVDAALALVGPAAVPAGLRLLAGGLSDLRRLLAPPG